MLAAAIASGAKRSTVKRMMDCFAFGSQ
jgi:hypothetical protein